MLTDNIKSEIKKVIVGKDEIIEKVLTAILAQGHILLEDVPGVGKTSLALAFSKALGLDLQTYSVHTGHNAFRCDRLFGFRKIKFRLCV